MKDLPKNQNFLNERAIFLDKIEKLEESDEKQRIVSLLNKLTNEVYNLENLHEVVLYNKRLPEEVANIRSNIMFYRKQLHEKLLK